MPTTGSTKGRRGTGKRSEKSKKAATRKKPAKKKSVDRKKPAKKKTVAKKTPAKKKTATKPGPGTITKRESRKRPTDRSRATKPLIGWRERVVLPEWSTTHIEAKVDSGAVTSTLHAIDLKLISDGDDTIARFEVGPTQPPPPSGTTVDHPVIGFKRVRFAGGRRELRPVVRTVVVIGEQSFEIDVTLASEDVMGFRMVLGRAAVRHRFLIDPGRSFLQPVTSDEGPANGP